MTGCAGHRAAKVLLYSRCKYTVILLGARVLAGEDNDDGDDDSTDACIAHRGRNCCSDRHAPSGAAACSAVSVRHAPMFAPSADGIHAALLDWNRRRQWDCTSWLRRERSRASIVRRCLQTYGRRTVMHSIAMVPLSTGSLLRDMQIAVSNLKVPDVLQRRTQTATSP